MRLLLRSLLVIAAALPLFGQSAESPTALPSQPPLQEPAAARSAFRSIVDLQFYNFGNFFQARQGTPERSVNALGAGYRLAWTRSDDAPEVYGRVSVLRYSGDASDTSYTGQLGLSRYGATHWYDVFVDHTRNGYSYDIEETHASANITSLWGHYSYPVAKDWRVGAETYASRTRFNVDIGEENDYGSLGVVVRYSGFGDRIKPRFGYVAGRSNSRDDDDDASDRYWYVQVGTEPRDGLEFSVRYRGRTLDYRNTAREENRGQWQLRASLRRSNGISWNAWYRLEDIDSSLPGRDFDRNTASVTVNYGF